MTLPKKMDRTRWNSGFRNHFETEALPGILPHGRNSPQRVAHGLYAEQLSGSAFTAPRTENLRSWLYRLRPTVLHAPFQKWDGKTTWQTTPFASQTPNPNPYRWNPLPLPTTPIGFLESVTTLVGTGSPEGQHGCTASLYAFNQNQPDRFLSNSDGELLFVPEKGEIKIRTELGLLALAPGWIGVIPRGVKFQVLLAEGETAARGYFCENYGAPFRLPDLGPIGANGLANPRDFLTPRASFEDREGKLEWITKLGGKFWRAELGHSPLDVVAWHGNYAPYQYDLALFNTINTVSFDHPDPSIFTVLTSPTDTAGTANVDFVIFPPRWMVGENTFRPPYYHRNIMSEFMGLIRGVYDAKEDGFVPGGASLHNCMAGHGPDASTFEKASHDELKPVKQENTLAFMFETRYPFSVTAQAENAPLRQNDYWRCWQGLKKAQLGE